jgi:YVTN family beta-propeller protein
MNVLRIRTGLALLAAVLAAGQSAASSAQVRIMQTNSRDTVVHLIDPATQRIAAEIESIPVAHGIAAAPDGSRIYISSEAETALKVVATRSLEVIASIPLTARPNNVAITPDGRYAIAGSIAGRRLTVIDTATDEEAWAWEGEAIRPVAIGTNPDGSTDKLYIQVSGHHGFVVFDWATRSEVTRITLPDIPPEDRFPGTYNGAPAHGIGVAPDGSTVWSTSRMNSHVYVYSLPDLELQASIPTGLDPDWVTFTPDSRFAYVANAVSNTVSVIDTRSFETVAEIPVGESPKRNGVITLPGDR